MTELELYKYITNNCIEWHWNKNNNREDVIIFPPFYRLHEFCELLGSFQFDDEGVNCVLKDGYVAIWMRDLCEENDIDIYSVFEKKE